MNHHGDEGCADLTFQARFQRHFTYGSIGCVEATVQRGGDRLPPVFFHIGVQKSLNCNSARIFSHGQPAHAVGHYGKKSGMTDVVGIIKNRKPEGILLLAGERLYAGHCRV